MTPSLKDRKTQECRRSEQVQRVTGAPSLNANTIGLAVAFIVAALFLLWRCLLSPGFGGEEPWGLAAALRFHLGDRPLVDSWDTNFSSAILALPFLKGYLATVGSTEGILLAFRSVFYTAVVATALAMTVCLRGTLSRLSAVSMGLLILFYMPFLAPYVGKAADYHAHMLSALTAVCLHRSAPRVALANLIPGVLSGIAVIGNPPTITVVPFFVWALVRAYPEPHRRRSAVWGYLLGGIGVGVVFLLSLLMLSGRDLFLHFNHVMSPDDHDFSLLAFLGRLSEGAWLLAIPILIGVLAGAISAGGRYKPDGRVSFWAMVVAMASGFYLAASDTIVGPVMPQSLVFVVGASLLLTDRLTRTTRLTATQLLLLLPAIGAGLGWFLGSNGGVFSFALASPLILGAAVASWESDTSDSRDS